MVLSALALVTLLVAAASAKRATATPDAGAGEYTTLGIEIPLANGPFTLPAAREGRRVSAHIRVPTVDSANARPDQVTAVRLMPRIVGDAVEVKVYALYGDVSKITSCDGWKSLKSSYVGEYKAASGGEFEVKELRGLGVSFGEKPLTVHVTHMKVAPQPQPQTPIVVTACECGSCGALKCCPDNGKCLGCGNCGSVCCE
jgi:hypothetical protein